MKLLSFLFTIKLMAQINIYKNERPILLTSWMTFKASTRCCGCEYKTILWKSDSRVGLSEFNAPTNRTSSPAMTYIVRAIAGSNALFELIPRAPRPSSGNPFVNPICLFRLLTSLIGEPRSWISAGQRICLSIRNRWNMFEIINFERREKRRKITNLIGKIFVKYLQSRKVFIGENFCQAAKKNFHFAAFAYTQNLKELSKSTS